MSDSNRQNQRQPPWEQGSESETVSFGTWLRRQRELREISLREIADVTKISIRYLEALEQDRFDVLPAPVFAKGFLKEYARYVGLDPHEVVNSYLTTQKELEPEDEEGLNVGREKRAGRRTSVGFLGLVVVALLLLVAALAYFAELRRSESRADPPPMAAPPRQAMPTPQTLVDGEPADEVPLLVTIDFSEDCWVEAVIDGERQISELHVPGESMRIEAAETVILTLGNFEAVRVEVNGRPFPVSGRPGEVLRNLVIDVNGVEALSPSLP
jgi:cytoskeletal protein RodZ